MRGHLATRLALWEEGGGGGGGGEGGGGLGGGGGGGASSVLCDIAKILPSAEQSCNDSLCDQACKMVNGCPRCSCYKGYYLDSDEYSCVSKFANFVIAFRLGPRMQ